MESIDKQSTTVEDLIEGKVEIKGKFYPLDWPCKCGHTLSIHFLPTGRVVWLTENSYLEKFGMCRHKDKPEDTSWSDYCVVFQPVDNLTYIEKMAKEQNV